MNPTRLRRLLHLLSLLQSGKGHNSASLAHECGVVRRTIFRDLDLLRQAGLPLEVDPQRQRYTLRSVSLLPPTAFTAEEALSLLLLCHEVGQPRGLPFQLPAASAALKIESNLPPVLREYLQALSGAVRVDLDKKNPLERHQTTYQQLLEAIGRRRAVRIRYDSLAENQLISTKLSPYRLWFTRRSWYVVGRSSLHRATRTFNVGRIRELQLLEDKFRIPQGFTLERYIRNAWHMIPSGDKDRDVLIRFQPLVAQNVAEVVWHKTQRLEFNPDKTLDFHVRVSGLWEIMWWVLGYGDQAEVFEPPELREAVLSRCKSLLARYDEPAATKKPRRQRPPRKKNA